VAMAGAIPTASTIAQAQQASSRPERSTPRISRCYPSGRRAVTSIDERLDICGKIWLCVACLRVGGGECGFGLPDISATHQKRGRQIRVLAIIHLN
jgi:hypothetical protein